MSRIKIKAEIKLSWMEMLRRKLYESKCQTGIWYFDGRYLVDL